MSTITPKELALDKNGLPGIGNHLDWVMGPRIRYVMPLVGHELQEIRPNASEEEMGARVLTLQQNEATPFHKNPEKDKMLVFFAGDFYVLTFEDGVVNRTHMNNTEKLFFISAGTPHALVATGQGVNKLLIVYAKNVADVVWQEGAVQLVDDSERKP